MVLGMGSYEPIPKTHAGSQRALSEDTRRIGEFDATFCRHTSL
jgi:hypothetical protein